MCRECVKASEVDTQPESTIEETPNFWFETSRRFSTRCAKFHEEERLLSTLLLTNDDLDRLAARHNGSPVAGAAPAVDGVVGPSPQRPDREVEPKRCPHVDLEPASFHRPYRPYRLERWTTAPSTAAPECSTSLVAVSRMSRRWADTSRSRSTFALAGAFLSSLR